MKIIIDTCVWSKFFQRSTSSGNPFASLARKLIRNDRVVMLGPIRQEILSGTQPDARFEQLRDYLRYHPNLQTDREDDENAAAYYNICRRRGIQGTGTDLFICAVAVRHGLSILTCDSDFDRYSEHLPIRLHHVPGA